VQRLRLLLWPAGAVLGLAAEGTSSGWGDPGGWVPDLVTGWTLIACGLFAWSRRPESRSGALMAATGFAWFAGNFASWALFLHRGPLVHLVVTYPTGRVVGRLERVAVAVGYLAAVVAPIWRNGAATLVLAAFLVVVAGRGYLGTVGRERRERLAALQATALLAAVLATTAAVRLVAPTQDVKSATLLAYELALCILAVVLLVGVIRAPWERATVTDLVVELGEGRSGTLRDALARALGDPGLEVGYWLPETGEYVDAAGRPVDIPPEGSHRRVTRIERDGAPVAVLVHDRAVLEDPGLVEAAGTAARLAAANARLQAEVREQVAELRESRRRLVRVADEERRRLEERLRTGAERRLAAVAEPLEQARALARDPDASQRIERAEGHLAGVLVELGELARGLHPRALTENGLAGALGSLAERSPVPVELAVPPERLPDDVEAAVYFACSEALANVAKHASASRVDLRVTLADGTVRVEITDDGVGGADPTRGAGLHGLTDRIEALGGRLRVESRRGAGTRIAAEIPVG
jgi:signal transduction histidine kinase